VCEKILNYFHEVSMPQHIAKTAPVRRGQKSADLVPLHVIRTETVLSKLPMHNLAKRGNLNIHIIKKDEHGKVDLYWEVSPNPKHGDPRQLSYKLDTIIINQRIDQFERPLPKLIKLGSLREIARELGLPPSDTNNIKDAALKNSATFITAKITYKGTDGTERQLEAGFTRYNVIFTGEKLPDGAKADAVYINLNDPYWEVLNNARIRPLNYDYLKELPPAPQRFYEIISYRMFSAIKYGRPHAKLLYSDYCTFSAQRRNYDYDHFKKQMYKVHRPHLQSGYLQKVTYEATLDADSKADWLMYYTPGPRAKAEYQAFNRKQLIEDEVLQENGHDLGEHKPASAMNPLVVQAEELVTYFYRRFHGTAHPDPTPKELQHATRLITKYGVERARYVVDFSYDQAPETDYRPQVFGGIVQYASAAVTAYDEHQARQLAEKAIQNCTLCDHGGWLSYTDAKGYSFAARCPHDLQKIQAREHAEGLHRNH
jgi:hypothetical protein